MRDIPLLDPDDPKRDPRAGPVGHAFRCHHPDCTGSRPIIDPEEAGPALVLHLRSIRWSVRSTSARASTDGSREVRQTRLWAAFCPDHHEPEPSPTGQGASPSLQVAHRCGVARCRNLLLRTPQALKVLEHPKRRRWMAGVVPVEGLFVVEPLCPRCSRRLIKKMQAASRQQGAARSLVEAAERLL